MKNTVIDLFCGVGGLTKGLSMAGLDVVAGIDCEKACKFAYEANNCAKFIESDINAMTPMEIEELYPNDSIKILAGCAPCQPFSKYTSKYRKNGYKDEKWKLLYKYSDLVIAIQPEIVTMENVPELRFTEVFKNYVEVLDKLGYEVSYSVVFCPDYGVPQNRRRLVLLASKLGKIELIKPTHSKTTYVSVRDAIGKLPNLRAGETNKTDIMHTCAKLSDINIQRIKASKPGGTWREWPDEIKLKCHDKKSGNTYGSVYGRMEWDKPSPTITTQFFGYGNGRFGHPEQDRAISLREGALLQSFPIDYKFIDDNKHVNKRQIGTQIGNAVPVKLGEAIGKSILVHIKNEQNDNEN